MIRIKRLPEPEILSKNKGKWLDKYLKRKQSAPGARPSSRQYGHPDIRNVLKAMSFGKCFYCECKLGEKEGDEEVDHYVEVGENPKLAFEWENLYLSCYGCNRKKMPNKSIPATDCVDPCDTNEDPALHLTFEDEFIRAKGHSPKGMNTIQKYGLDRTALNYRRVKQLQQFEKLLRRLRERQIQEGRKKLKETEKELLERFKAPDHGFSLMFSVYLSQIFER